MVLPRCSICGTSLVTAHFLAVDGRTWCLQCLERLRDIPIDLGSERRRRAHTRTRFHDSSVVPDPSMSNR